MLIELTPAETLRMATREVLIVTVFHLKVILFIIVC